MKKFLLLALPVLAAIVVIPAAFAGNGPANKATADLSFNNGGLNAHWVFDAHDLGTTGDKGSVFYQDANGIYSGDVIDATVSSTSATFTARVTSSTSPGISAGDTLIWTVYDKGEGSNAPGIDYFTWQGGVLGGNNNPGPFPTEYPITAGNIQIHFNG